MTIMFFAQLLAYSRFFFFQAEDGIRDLIVTGVQTCALPISPARRGLPRRLCLTCAANHGPRGRARHPSRGRVPRTGARRLRERGLPAVPHALLAGRERWDAARVGVGRGGPLPAARGWGRAGPGPAGPMDLLPVAHRSRPDLPLVPLGRAAARDGAVGGAVRAHPVATQPGTRARAFHGDAVARLGARVSVDVPLRYHEAREWRPHVAPPHRPRLPLLDSTASPLAGVVRAVAPRMDPPGDDARDHRDRDPGALADRGSRPLGAVGASGALHGVRAPGVRPARDRADGQLRVLQLAGDRLEPVAAR